MTLVEAGGEPVERHEEFAQEIKDILEADCTVAHISSDLIKPQIKAWRDAHEGASLPDEVRWEKLALDLHALDRRRRKGAQERFQPLCRFPVPDTDPPEVHIYPDVDGLMDDEEAISYYCKRIEETSSQVRRARYADIVYCSMARQGGDVYQYGMKAADAYLAQTSLCLEQERYFELIANLDRAAEFAVLFNNKDLAAETTDHIRDALDKVVSRQGFRWALWLCDTLLFLNQKQEDIVDCDTGKEIQVICEEGISYSRDSEDWRLARSLMQLGATVAELMGDESEAWEYQVQEAAYLKEQARQRETREGPTGGSLTAFKIMEMAVHAYQRLVSLAPDDDKKELMREEVAETRREARRLIRQSEEEMQEHQVSIDVPRNGLEREVIEPLLESPPEETLAALACHPNLVPNIDDIRAQATEPVDQYLLHHLFSHIHLRDGRKVDEISLQDDESAQLMEHLGYWFKTHIRLLDFALHRLREEDRFTANSFVEHIKRWDFVSEVDLPFIETGVERYFSGDFISALHVLTPRVEHMLKSALEQVGVSPVAVPNQRQILEQTFGSFLHRPDVRESLGETIWYYLDFALVNERGLNIRNDVAHGWVASPQCNRYPVQVVLFAILLLTRLRRADGS
jgi:lysyl-tRNA synthetase class 1